MYLERSSSSGSGYVNVATVSLQTKASLNDLLPGKTYSQEVSGTLPDGTWYIRACAWATNVSQKVCTAPERITVGGEPPQPITSCKINFNNRVTGVGGDIRTYADVSIGANECPVSKYKDLSASGGADDIDSNVTSIYDSSIPRWYTYADVTDGSVAQSLFRGIEDLLKTANKLPSRFAFYVPGPDGGTMSAGYSMTRVYGTGSPLVETSSLYGASGLPFGNYSYEIGNEFAGTYICNVRNTTVYYPACDSRNAQYVDSATCLQANPTGSGVTSIRNTEDTERLNVNTSLAVCIDRRDEGNVFYNENCVEKTADAMSIQPTCAIGKATFGATPRITEKPPRLSQPPFLNTPPGTSLGVPTVLTSTPACNVGAGAIQVWGKTPVVGATGYRLYRSSASSFTPSSSNLVRDFTSTSPFPFSDTTTAPVNAYVDGGALANNSAEKLTGGVQYNYKLVAYNSSSESLASVVAQDDASFACPDLVVNKIEGISVTPEQTITLTNPIRSGLNKSFSAGIFNQGGMPAVPFDNRFTIKNSSGVSTIYTIFPDTRVSSDLQAGGVSSIVSNLDDTWDTVPGSYRLEVCSDTRRPPDIVGEVFEYNGYNGVTDTAETNNCSYLNFVVGEPDLTANPPVATGQTLGTSFVSKTPITLNGAVNNSGSGATYKTQNGTFDNSYEVSIKDPATGAIWTPLSPTVPLLPVRPFLDAGVESATLQELIWGGDGSIAAGDYWVQTCADVNTSIEEKNENNNCSSQSLGVVSGVTKVTVVDIPVTTLIVRTLVDGTYTGGIAVEGDPSEFGGTTYDGTNSSANSTMIGEYKVT
ncbi:hypothetical protein COU76_00030, partial [Candidatus Peregrinibacteria bacterium CG10_big_fil_rev_8_21_14_0_10_49_10]